MERDLQFYRALPYSRTVSLVEDDGGDGTYFLAHVEELPSVKADGESHVEALYNLSLAFDDYISAMLAVGRAIPEPELWPPEELEIHTGRVVGQILRQVFPRPAVSTTPDSHMIGDPAEIDFELTTSAIAG
jgi:predicted RNase H-like HicB family nuclease